MKSKRLMAGLMGAALLMVPSAALAESTDVHLLINNVYVGGTEETGEAYISDEGRTMIPLRLVSDVLEYQTEWKPDGSISITDMAGKVDVQLTIGSLNFTANGETGIFETVPTLKNGRTYLPARDFSELYGKVCWDGDTRTVWITQNEETQYQVIGTKLMRADVESIQHVTLPDGYTIYHAGYAEPIVGRRVIDDTTYLAIMCKASWTEPVPLFRDDGTHLTYLTDIYPSSFYVDDNAVYYTDGVNAGAWNNPIEPNRLYIATIGDDDSATVSVNVGFAINQCTLGMEGNVLIATDLDGDRHELNVDELLADAK